MMKEVDMWIRSDSFCKPAITQLSTGYQSHLKHAHSNRMAIHGHWIRQTYGRYDLIFSMFVAALC